MINNYFDVCLFINLLIFYLFILFIYLFIKKINKIKGQIKMLLL